VTNSYNLPCVTGLAGLPTNVYAQAIAKIVVTRPSPGVRFLSFSGYDWWVKNDDTPVGPGPNYFSDLINDARTEPQLCSKLFTRSQFCFIRST
jgi:hypothetical protein